MSLEKRFGKFEKAVGLDDNGLTWLCLMNADMLCQYGHSFLSVGAYALAGLIAYPAVKKAVALWDDYLRVKNKF